MTILFLNTETTGLNTREHSIWELSGIFEVDGEVKDSFVFHPGLCPGTMVDNRFTAPAGLTVEELKSREPMKSIHSKLSAALRRFCDPYDPKNKIWLSAFNLNFHESFLRTWFVRNLDPFFNSWFWSGSLDSMAFASYYLKDRRSQMPDFKRETVAQELGIVPEREKTDPLYKPYLDRSIYRIATGIDLEL